MRSGAAPATTSLFTGLLALLLACVFTAGFLVGIIASGGL